MADHADDDDDVFVYTGGRVPEHLREIITHARIDKSVRVIDDRAFEDCPNLLDVDVHDGVERVGKWAFRDCLSFLRVTLPGVEIIGVEAFENCVELTDVEFGNKLETIGNGAYWGCTSLRRLNIPFIRTIERYAFWNCGNLTDAEFGEGLELIGEAAFRFCRLRRITIPLKADMFTFDDVDERYTQFDGCERLTTVEIVGGGEIHDNIVSHLSLLSWRNEMNQEINRINQFLPTTPATGKTGVIQEWIQWVLDRIEHYKAEHHNLLKEATTLLELALWKAKLRQDEEEDSFDTTRAKKAKIDVASARQERRVTCGADTIIKNVLPFLKLPTA